MSLLTGATSGRELEDCSLSGVFAGVSVFSGCEDEEAAADDGADKDDEVGLSNSSAEIALSPLVTGRPEESDGV